jgi:predicted DNA-binding transcriptional regulator AlpA
VDGPKYLNTNQLAKLINRSEPAIRNLVLRRSIPFRKVGGRLVFIRSEIEDWIDNANGIRLEDLEKGKEKRKNSYS